MSNIPLDLRMLAYAFSDKRVLLSMISIIRADFFRPEFRALWELISNCFIRYKEVPTAHILEHVSGIAWEQLETSYNQIIQIISQVDSRNYLADMEQLKARFNDQLLRKAGQSIFQKNWDGTGFADLSEANKTFRDTVVQIERLYKTNTYKEGTLAGTAEEAWIRYQQVKHNPEKAAGIHLGFSELDRITNGIRDSELLLIGGESGTGKSAMAMNMAANAWLWKNKIPIDPDSPMDVFPGGRTVVYFTIEMPYEQLERRLHACVAGVPLYGIRDGTLNAVEEMRYRAALKFLKKCPNQFHIIDIPRGATMRHVEAKYMELCQDDKIELVVVDYLNLMSVDEDGEVGQDWLKIGHIAEQAHEFTRVQHIPMISPAQLNRPPKEESARMARPDQDRLARSLMLAQNANIIANIEKRKDEHLLKDMRLHVVKNRDGEQSVIVLQKRLDIMRLYDSPSDWDISMYEAKDST
jgi:replicative DNA helicase